MTSTFVKNETLCFRNTETQESLNVHFKPIGAQQTNLVNGIAGVDEIK